MIMIQRKLIIRTIIMNNKDVNDYYYNIYKDQNVRGFISISG